MQDLFHQRRTVSLHAGVRHRENGSGHFYRRLPHGLYLYYRREGAEEVLYNAQHEPLWRGERMEVLNEGVILHDADGKSRKVLYMDIIFGNVDG